jgi:hypothetical protein
MENGRRVVLERVTINGGFGGARPGCACGTKARCKLVGCPRLNGNSGDRESLALWRSRRANVNRRVEGG